MQKYRRFRKIARLFRLMELFLAVVLLSWISTRLPFVVRISGVYFRLLLSIIVSLLFIFLIGNVIALTLVVKSGLTEDAPIALKHEEIVYQDKQIISEVNSKPTKASMNSVTDLDLKIYRRSQSENLMKRESEKFNAKLKRSETPS